MVGVDMVGVERAVAGRPRSERAVVPRSVVSRRFEVPSLARVFLPLAIVVHAVSDARRRHAESHERFARETVAARERAETSVDERR